MQTITTAELKKRLDQGERLTLIDVREADEVAQGIIPGAIHIPLGDIPHRTNDIPRSGETILICRSGGRSGRAYDYLTAQGYENLKNLTGGMLEWSDL